MSLAVSVSEAPSLTEAAGPAARPDIDPRAGAVLRARIAKSPYRAMLEPITAEVERVAFGTNQIRAALETLARTPAPARSFWQRPGVEEAAISAFLEYVAFASPAFLTSVGEWPLGQVRG
ncbi:hypothetical protein ABLE91_01520 [Aquabacter sp. CN5-332]|uniref:hypothetical protein n=1 Tax=Aquabacter sp. CN5-332 TaxID=3156608 RepID=UPI0032B5776B